MKCILMTFASFADVRFSNNTSMSYEVILKTGLPLAGDSTSGDRQGTTAARAGHAHHTISQSDYGAFFFQVNCDHEVSLKMLNSVDVSHGHFQV